MGFPVVKISLKGIRRRPTSVGGKSEAPEEGASGVTSVGTSRGVGTSWRRTTTQPARTSATVPTSTVNLHSESNLASLSPAPLLLDSL